MRRPAALLLLTAASATAGLARERRRRERAERYAAALLETLLHTIDATDSETGAHVRRVAAVSLVLAQAAGLRDTACTTVERVALFHDIGKIAGALHDAVYDGGTLTPDEREQIRQHPQLGAEVLAPLGAFDPDLPAGVLAHHERWDGTGYPAGLSGASIPIAARIVAIADTYDAITHQRRYRPARTAQEALAIIREAAGAQFDPALVRLLLRGDVRARVEARLARGLGGPAWAEDRRAGTGAPTAPDVSFRWRGEGPMRRTPGPRRRARS